MPDWLNEPGEWSAVVTIVGAVMAALLWLIRSEVQRTRKEFRPNGGGSLRDQVDLIVKRQTDVIDDLGYLRNRLDQHIDHHNDGRPYA